jgi:hypothetical protein
MRNQLLGRHLTLEEFCTCTRTHWKYADSFATRLRARLDPYPKNLEETIPALQALCQQLLDPVIDYFGKERFQLTYGFCSTDLKRFLSQQNPETGIKNGRVDPIEISIWHMRRTEMASIAAIDSVLPVIFGLWGWRAIVLWSGF